MNFIVFAYNFPHWKTQQGLLNLHLHGYRPRLVVLQDKKQLTHRHSHYRITPEWEYLTDPVTICERLQLPYITQDHDDYQNDVFAEYAVILGARILKEATISRYRGVVNIHPGILPGNRGLDNLKWSIIEGLPIGVTAHFIDQHIDRGRMIQTYQLHKRTGKSIRDLYIEQRNLEMQALIQTMQALTDGLTPEQCLPIAYSPKFDAVPEHIESRYWPLGLQQSVPL